jgi:hypothetical protein
LSNPTSFPVMGAGLSKDADWQAREAFLPRSSI